MKKYLLIFIPLLAIATCYFVQTKDNIPFDSEQWKNWEYEETKESFNLRKRMISSLTWNYNLKGMTKEEIIELLGSSESRFNSEFHFDYWIGFGAGPNQCMFSVVFDKTEKVINYRTYEH